MLRGDVNAEVIIGFNFFILILFSIFCLEILVLLFIAIINPDVPNNPDSRGRRGSLMFMFKTKNPRSPDIIKTAKLRNLFFAVFSMKTKFNEIQMRRKGMRFAATPNS